MTLARSPVPLAVCQLAPDAAVPPWADAGGPVAAVLRDPDELTVVCRAAAVPDGVRAEAPWTAFTVAGPLDFGLVGVLAALTRALADASIPVFALSTYRTDHLLVRAANADAAAAALRAAGHRVTP